MQNNANNVKYLKLFRCLREGRQARHRHRRDAATHRINFTLTHWFSLCFALIALLTVVPINSAMLLFFRRAVMDAPKSDISSSADSDSMTPALAPVMPFVFIRGVGAVTNRHTFTTSYLVAEAFNASSLKGSAFADMRGGEGTAAPPAAGGSGSDSSSEDERVPPIPYTFARAARGNVPTISNPFILIEKRFGLNGDGKITVRVDPIKAFSIDYERQESSVTTAGGEGNAQTRWLNRLPDLDVAQRIVSVGFGGVGECVPPAASHVQSADSGGGSSDSTVVTRHPSVLQQAILAPSRLFLYVRVVALSRVPSALLDRLSGHEGRRPSQWTTAEVRMWCSIPHIKSGRIHPLTGGTVSYSPPHGTSVQTFVYIVQCSEIPFSISYESILVNGDNSGTSLENLQMTTIYSISAGFQTIPFVAWTYFLLRRGVRGLGWIPSRRDAVIALSMLSAMLAAGASVAWVAAVSDTTISDVATTPQALTSSIVRLVGLVVRDGCIWVLMPLIATGYCTVFSSLSLRIRSLVLVSLVVYFVLTTINYVCENRIIEGIDFDDDTCQPIRFGQKLLKTMNRLLSVILLVKHIRKLSELMMLHDAPAYTSLFFRAKSLRVCFFVLMVLPFLIYIVDTSIVSWYNQFIVTLGTEFEVAFFHFICMNNIGGATPVLW